MVDVPDAPARPEDIPADIAAALEAHAMDAHGLHEAIIYAHELLNAHHGDVLTLEPGAGEEVVRVRDRGEYTEVVKRHRGETEAYVYHVRREPHPNGTEDLHWVLIGRDETDRT